MNLVEAIQQECNRLRDNVLPVYDEIPSCQTVAAMMRETIQEGENAIADCDAAACVRALTKLRGFQL